MSTRRSIITRLPAALALAVLPSRLTQRVQAQEATLVSEWVDVPGVEDQTAAAPYTTITMGDFGGPLPLMDEVGPEIISMSPDAPVVSQGDVGYMRLYRLGESPVVSISSDSGRTWTRIPVTNFTIRSYPPVPFVPFDEADTWPDVQRKMVGD